MSLRISLPYLWGHPLGRRHFASTLMRYAGWQLRCRLRPGPVVMPWINGTSLWVDRGLTGATGNLYCGLHEWPDMVFMLHLLRPGDTFADIGANVGSYTVLASAAVGASTVAFEPTPDTFAWLQRNLALNHLEGLVTAHQAAAGAARGTVFFRIDQGCMNQVVAAGYSGHSQPVEVVALDDIPSIAHACCWKLDVEGYEPSVLAGAARTLAEAPPAAILCEDRSKPVQQHLSGAGFQACSYDPWTRTLSLDVAACGGNQLWIRDLDWARERVSTAPVFQVLGQYV